MKRNLLLIAFLFFAHLSFGQVKIYPKVGMVVSTQQLEGYVEENSKIKNRAGFLAGVGLEGRVYQNLSWNTDLQFAQLGYIEEYKTRHSSYKETYKLNYLVAPIGLKYDVTSSSHKLFLTGGVYGSIFMGGKYRYYNKDSDYSSNGGNSFYVNDRFRYDRFDWGLQLGCGYGFAIGQSEFIADARYSLGMSDVHEARIESMGRMGSVQSGYNGRNRFLSLSLGYVLPYAKRAN